MSVIHRAPWQELMPNGKLGPEYNPISVRTGRACSQDRAEQEYIEKYGSLHAIPYADDPVPVTLLDIPGAERYDQKLITDFVNRHSRRLSQRELDVYVSFWVERRSYAGCARMLDIDRDAVRDAVKRIRRKAIIRSLSEPK